MNPDAYIGQQIDLDGYPSWQPYQCYDWANFWSQKLGYRRFTGLKASDIFGQQPENYIWVKNTPDGVPPEASIVVWDDGINGTVGHVAVGRKGSDTNVCRTDDQNWGQPRVVAVDHNYNHIIGWGIPKGNISNVISQGDNDVIVNDENNYARANKTHMFLRRNRTLDRSIFNQFVGKPWLSLLEVCEDDPEANEWQLDAQVGTIARRDKWDQQIYSLQDQLKAANDVVKTLQAGDVVDKQTIADLQKKVQELTAVPPVQPTQGFTPSDPIVKRSIIDKIINLIWEGKFE